MVVQSKGKNLKRGNNASQAYELLKKKIITLQIKPGEYLDEKGLMKELKIGRTPLREAILLLKNEKLLTLLSNSKKQREQVQIPALALPAIPLLVWCLIPLMNTGSRPIILLASHNHQLS